MILLKNSPELPPHSSASRAPPPPSPPLAADRQSPLRAAICAMIRGSYRFARSPPSLFKPGSHTGWRRPVPGATAGGRPLVARGGSGLRRNVRAPPHIQTQRRRHGRSRAAYRCAGWPVAAPGRTERRRRSSGAPLRRRRRRRWHRTEDDDSTHTCCLPPP